MLHVLVKNDEGYEQFLDFNQNCLQAFTHLSPHKVHIAAITSPERQRVEQFIETTFKNAYNATIAHHYPILMSVRDEHDRILGALGFRYAKDEPLFLEHYLDGPIELHHHHLTGHLIPRHFFVESGNLASLGHGASIFLFTAMHAYLLEHGFSTIAVTATNFLHRYFLRLGLSPHVLGYADQSCLPDHGASWGSYYQANPRVITGNLGESYQKLKQHLQLHFSGETEGFQSHIHLKPESSISI